MAAYVIADVNVTDPVAYEEYKKATPGSIATGRFMPLPPSTGRAGFWPASQTISINCSSPKPNSWGNAFMPNPGR